MNIIMAKNSFHVVCVYPDPMYLLGNKRNFGLDKIVKIIGVMVRILEGKIYGIVIELCV